jgi:uncharacterized protein YjdB
MFGSSRPRHALLTIAGLMISATLGCGEPAGPGAGASVHGAPPGVGDGRANTIQITPAVATVEEGVTAPLTCSALDSRGVVVSSTRNWTVSDPSVATVGDNGVVTGQTSGNAVATCTIDGKSAMATISVVPSPVAFVEVTPGAGIVPVGGSMQLIATPRDSTGAAVSGHAVKFVTPDSSVAAVSSSGSIAGRIEGAASITAMSGGKASTVKVNVSKKNPPPVAGISIKLTSASLAVGQTSTATATTVDANGQTLTGRAITWSVDNSSVMSQIAVGSNQDKVTGRSPGQAVLTATSEGKSTTVTVPVSAASVATVSVSLAANTILPGQSTQATATVTDASGNVLSGRTVTYASMDTTIATVSASGLVTGVATGAVIIRATSEGKTGDASVTVSVPSVATVAVSLASPSLTIGQTTVATATYKDASGATLSGRSVQWTSLSPNIATVSIAGVVTAVAPGSATIRATVESKTGDGTASVAATQQTTAKMYWTVNLTSTLAVGATMQIGAAPYDASGQLIAGKTVTYTSSNSAYATMSSTGLLTGVAPGTVTVTATADGISLSTQVTITGVAAAPVAPGPVSRVTVTLSKASVVIGDSAQATAAAFDAAGTPVSGVTIAWSTPTASSTIATVDAAGKVKSKAAGTASIVASASGITGSADLAVTTTQTFAPTVPTGTPAAVLAFAGPEIMKSQVPAAFSFYENNFKSYSDAQWAAYGPRYDAGNSISGYERAAIYYIWWARTGDTTYLSRAHQTAVNYRDNYLIPANYATSPHWSQMESLYLDWIVTGDTKSRDAVLNVGNIWIAFLLHDKGTPSYLMAQSEGRQRARIMISEWMVEKITGTRNQWLDSAIVQTVGVLNTQGFAPDASTCGGSLNYMGGMTMDALTRLHDQRANGWNTAYNSAIETKALAFGNYLWSSQWRGASIPGDNSFNYMSVLCDGTGSPTSAPDLNGLVIPLFGWLGKSTGDATWFTKGDQILNGMQTAYIDQYRQFSESYTSSHRYLGYRWGN